VGISPACHSLFNYWSVIASLTPSAANVTANDRCHRAIYFGELITCRLTQPAVIPNKIKIIIIIAINTALKANIPNTGDEVTGEAKSDRKAKKNMEIYCKNPTGTWNQSLDA